MTILSRDKSIAPSYATLLFICCGVAFGGYLGSHMRLPVVPLYALSLGADTVQVGIINSAFLLMAGLLSLPLGILSDRFGRKRLACIGVLILSATSYLLYFSTTPMQMVWIYLFFGIGLAAFGPTMMSLVADISPPTHLGRSYGWYTTALYTSMSLGPAVGGFVAKELGFLQVFLISGTLIFLTFWLIVFFLPRARLVVSSTPKKDKWSAAAGELMQNRPLLGCWLVTIGGCFGLGMFVTFLPLHAQNQGLHVGQIGIVFAVQGISNALSRIPFGHLSDKVAKRGTLVVIGLLGFVGSMVGFAISESAGHFIIFAAALGISMGLAFTSVGALIAEVVPPESRGLAMGGYNTCIYFGMMLSSALMGPVIQVIGFEGGFHITALINFLFIGFFYLFMKGFSLTRVEQ
ncbi:MAG: MFS transporter [Deltaproteobacteria bacterium]|nr:MAG: MFS transporter [Deltaproteobacteria bacterium]